MKTTYRRRLSLRALLLSALLLLVVSGCQSIVSLDPAPDSNNPNCAPVIVRLPDEVGRLAKRETDAQATGAWGDPVQVILTCGLAPLGPVAQPCFTYGDIDWVIDDTADDVIIATVFGRDPGLSVKIDGDLESPATVLKELSYAISFLPENERSCLG